MSDRNHSKKRSQTSLIAVAALAAATVVAAIGMTPSGESSTRRVHFTSGSAGPISFTGQLSRGAVVQGGDGQVRMKLLVGAEPSLVSAATRVPTDVLVVLDRSGSMEGTKIDYARRAVEELFLQLDERDRFALVSYSSEARLDIPLSAATSKARDGWRRITSRVAAGGGTNMSGGIELALETLAERSGGRASRVILLSDGLANEGDASFEGLTHRARRAAKREYVMSAIGIGADFNEYLMSGLADAGTGNYYYLESTQDLASVFAREFEATRMTVATGVDIEIEPGEGVSVLDAAGYPLEREGNLVRFRPGSLFAGQQREIWVTLSVPVDTLGEHGLGAFVLRYTADGERSSRTLSGRPMVACVPDRERMLASVDKEVWEASVVEEDYNRLQEEVALAVKKGARQEAERAIESYRVRNGEMNEALASPVVERNLDELKSLAREVEDAFTGADQELKQNRMSKQRQASSWDGRRAGSKKAPK